MNRNNLSLSTIVTAIAVLFWLFVMQYAYFQAIPRARYGVVFLGVCIILYCLNEVDEAHFAEERFDIAVLSFSIVVTLVATSYVAINFYPMYLERIGYSLTHEYVMAVFFIAVVTYLAWREFGKVFLIMIVGMILYGLFGYLVPGVLGHGGLTYTRVLNISMLGINGVYGSITLVVAAWVALFLLYAGLLNAYGAFDIIIRASLYSTNYARSGVAQTAVIASAIIGSINGSRTANSALTGSITIPLMKDTGYSSETAAAIEADASSLGQILPPVMGSAGFLMASFLGVTYTDIMIGALLPALILIACIIVAVHYVATSEVPNPNVADIQLEGDAEPVPREKLPAEGVRFLLPFFVLIYLLGIARYSVPRAALYTCFAMLITGIGVPMLQTVRHSPEKNEVFSEFKTLIGKTIAGAKTGALIMAPVALIVAAINIVVDILLATGVPSALTLVLFGLSGGVMAIAAIIAMMVGVILGLGMPTVAAYTIVAILIAPTFVTEFGVPEQGAHFFALYAALLSGITPPIASACAVTAGIAGSNFLKTCFAAVRIFAPMFVIPVTFLYHPEIVSSDPTLQSVYTGVIVFFGAVSIIYGLNHISPVDGVTGIVVRTIYSVAGALIMVYPDNLVQIALIGAVVVFTFGYRSVVDFEEVHPID